MSPCVSDNVIMRLFDYDMGRKDEIVGTIYFNIKDIINGIYK